MIDNSLEQAALDHQRVEQAIRYVQTHFRQRPTLEKIAAAVHLSPYHFQRLFKRWAGLTPTQFMHALTVEYAKTRLNAATTVLDTALDAGLSSAGRLHHLFVTIEALTPGQYKQRGADLTITYGFHPTPFGRALLAMTERGICALRFVTDETAALDELQEEWPQAQLKADPARTRPTIQHLFAPPSGQDERPFHLLLKGTNFQVQVWRALLAIPPGALVSYGDVAAHIGRPKASRAVGSAIGRNPIGYLIPCHRVIAASGAAHNYRWGAARKQALLAWEAGQTAGLSSLS